MKQYTILCARAQDLDDVDPRCAIATATDGPEAEEMCRRAYSGEGYTSFKADDGLDGPFAGPTLIGYTGQGPFSWKGSYRD
jgi:hypothetical protein